MSSLDLQLTKEDFINSTWQDVVSECDRKDCLSYRSKFWRKAEAEKQGGNHREQSVFEFLTAITQMPIRSESTDEYFAERLKNLTNEQLQLLEEIVEEISDAELQARIADILWVLKRKYKMAQLAISAYLQSAKTLENPDQWTYCFDRIERAARLALKINHKVDDVFAHIEKVLDRYQAQDPLWLSAKLMRLLQEFKRGEPQKYIELSEKAANFAESQSNWNKARSLWEIKAIWHRQENDRLKELEALMKAAETFVKEAEAALTESNPSYIKAAHFMQYAVVAFRNIQGTNAETADARIRAEEAHKLLLEYQEKSRDEMTTHSHEWDVSQFVEEARNYVRGKTFQEALFSLILIYPPTDVTELREQVKKDAQEFWAADLFPTVKINDKGKVVARQSTFIASSDPEESEKATYLQMCEQASFYQSSHAQITIEPARCQINLEHCLRINDILSIISYSPFIPPERRYLFAKGLYAGLMGDFFTSIHILIPQIENSVRYLMWEKGIITSGLDDRGIQNEHNLNSTLYHPKIGKIFDENTLFDLKCLLVERTGSNLRNRMAHGLINDVEFSHNHIMPYIWWLTFRLCLLPIWYEKVSV